MSDGAHHGFGAHQSRDAVRGDERARTHADRTPDQMAAYLESCPDEIHGYEDVARWAGRGVLRYLRKHPEAFANGSASEVFDAAFASQRGEPDARGHRPLPEQIRGISGFMVGWAVNAARYACGHSSVRNPAIL